MGMRYHTRVLEDAGPDTFEAIGTEYGKDATTVYEWDIPILHADPRTFKRLTENYAEVGASAIARRLTHPSPW